MASPFVLVTGFGPFLDVDDNPSGRLARILGGRSDVVGLELPTSFGRAGAEIDALIADASPKPSAILALGVHRDGYFRLERRASALPPCEKLDVDGRTWGEGPRLPRSTRVDLAACCKALDGVSPLPVRISEDAGGYVCDFVTGHVLALGEQMSIHALFLHVPPQDLLAVEDQEPVVEALIDELWRQVPHLGVDR